MWQKRNGNPQGRQGSSFMDQQQQQQHTSAGLKHLLQANPQGWQGKMKKSCFLLIFWQTPLFSWVAKQLRCGKSYSGLSKAPRLPSCPPGCSSCLGCGLPFPPRSAAESCPGLIPRVGSRKGGILPLCPAHHPQSCLQPWGLAQEGSGAAGNSPEEAPG